MGDAGAFYLTREPDWVKRYVETVRFGSGEERRQLTIDVELPLDPEAVVAKFGDQRLYCVPITNFQKFPPVASVDLRDEDGRALALMTRQENAEISELAFLTAITDALGEPPSDRVALAVELLVYEEHELALFGSELLNAAFEQDDPRLEADALKRFTRVATELRSNFYLWLPLLGLPGERRVSKFSFRLPGTSPVLVKRAEVPHTTSWRLGDEQIDVPGVRPGRILFGETWDLLRQRAMGLIGWDAIDVRVSSPKMRGSDSYHLQVLAPDVSEVISVTTERELLDTDGSAVDVRTHSDGNLGHLTVNGRDLDHAEAALIAIRVPRSGFLNLCLVLSVLVAVLLWSLQESATQVSADTPSQVATTVLLVVPAILILLVVRPSGESALASSLLAGVRGLMLATAFLAAAAGAALAGVQPFEHVSETYIWYAAAASAIVLVLLVAWLAAGRRTRRYAGRAYARLRSAPVRPRWVLSGVAVTLTAVAAAAWAIIKPWPVAADHRHQMGLLVLACSAVLWCGSQVGRAGKHGCMSAPARLLTWLLAAIAVLFGARLLGADPAHIETHDVAQAMVAVYIAGVAAVSLACLLIPVRREDGGYNA